VQIATPIAASPRGELEITDVNRATRIRKLSVMILGRGSPGLTRGLPNPSFRRKLCGCCGATSGLKIGSVEEVAYTMGSSTPPRWTACCSNQRESVCRHTFLRIIHEADYVNTP